MSDGAPLIAHYEIAHTTWRHHYDVASNGRHIYHVDNSSMKVGKPDLTFHCGPDNNAPIAGTIKFHHFSSDIEIGVGDPRNPSAVRWERVTREGHMSLKHAFRTTVNGQQRQFTWKRTKHMGEGRFGNMKLVDESTQAVIAVFSSGSAFSRQTGKLEVYADFGPQFQLLVLQSCLALRERIRRTNNSAAAAGGAGGGGA